MMTLFLLCIVFLICFVSIHFYIRRLEYFIETYEEYISMLECKIVKLEEGAE